MKGLLTIFLIVLNVLALGGQTPVDALYMNHKQICIAGIYQNNSWNQYWEGLEKRDNQNLGSVTHQSALLMGAFGLSSRLNLMVMVPYITSKASQGSFAGQSGLQDLSVWLKYKILDQPVKGGKFKGFILGGTSFPISDYVPDYLPMCIGLQTRTATVRSVFDYHLNNGLYLTLRAGFTHRSNIIIDRNAYQVNGRLIYTQEVAIPNVADAGFMIGWRKKKWLTALVLDHFKGISGDDIRPNDMPFPTNKMIGSSLGILLKYQGKHWGITCSSSNMIQGRNIGKSRFFQVGGLYLFDIKKGSKMKTL